MQTKFILCLLTYIYECEYFMGSGKPYFDRDPCMNIKKPCITVAEVPRYLLYCYSIKVLVLVLPFEANWPKYHN